MQLKPGRKYETKSGHVFTAIELVEEPGEGSQMLGTILGPNGPQFELYGLDGRYKKNVASDWDLIKELAISAPIRAEKPPGLFDTHGQPIYPFVEVKAHVLAENGPIIRFSHSPEPIEGYVSYKVMSDAEIRAAEEIAIEKEK